ncbi:helix-turn-helix transcriptional regulator [Micromonospora arborensis]|uniref:helix-turn-helix domain-containing protein n=1 Tax=Micromonospora arborensis TaxID=2116518 RepID=UPI00340F56DD
MKEQTGRPVLIFDAKAFDAAVADRGYDKQEDKADFLGVSRSSYSKVTRGLEQPSPKFIAAVLIKLSDPDSPDTLNRFFKAEIR